MVFLHGKEEERGPKVRIFHVASFLYTPLVTQEFYHALNSRNIPKCGISKSVKL